MDAENHQIGLVSFGQGCGEKGYPGVYSRISAVSSWMKQAMCMSHTHRPSFCTGLRLDFTYDKHPGETGWKLFDATNDTIYESSEGSVRSSGRQSTVLNVMRNNTYRLQVIDSFGDGICCR